MQNATSTVAFCISPALSVDHHALWFACVHGDPELVSLLIACGANIDNQNVNGATCAIYSGSTG